MGNIYQNRVSPGQPMYLQVQDEIRGMIKNGELLPGKRLPASVELARQLGTSTHTVHSALSSLVKEGLLERRQKLGTVVKSSDPMISRVAIHYDGDFWSRPEMEYSMRLHEALERHLRERGIECRIFVNSMIKKKTQGLSPELVPLIKKRVVQALLIPLSGLDHRAQLEELRIPYSIHTGTNLPRTVGTDYHQMLELAVKNLKDAGCRSVGIISQFGLKAKWFYDDYLSIVKESGLSTRDEWILHNDWEAPSMSSYGDHQFQRLWSQVEKPDGLFVYHDVNARGVINAICRLGVDIPGKLKLIVHHSEGVDFNQPFPLMSVTLSPDDVAEAMIRQIYLQLNGKRADRVLIPYKLKDLIVQSFGGTTVSIAK
ncbi:MAG: GntR family transcriptional regulator [Victivallales bacterium]